MTDKIKDIEIQRKSKKKKTPGPLKGTHQALFKKKIKQRKDHRLRKTRLRESLPPSGLSENGSRRPS